MFDVTVAICTSGERAMLPRALGSVVAQERMPAGGLELLVVDNSKDDTGFVRRAIDEVARETTVPVRYVREPRPGLGFARNAAIASAQGEVVAFVDDDALVDPDWSWELVRAYRETGADAVGGRIDPLWERERPDWLSDELLSYLSLLDWGAERKRFHHPRYPFGANVSFRRAALLEMGGFTDVLGVGGDRNYSMDETELCRRFERAGKTILYAPHARVRHLVPASRLTRPYFIQRAAMHGRSTARAEHVEREGRTSGIALAKGLALAAVRVGRHGARTALYSITRDEVELLSEMRHLVWNLAWMRESISVARQIRWSSSTTARVLVT